MRHTVSIEGFGVRLRPVRMEDAEFIVWLRNQDYVMCRVGDSTTTIAGQEAWLKNYFERAGDYYFLIETLGGLPVGAYGLYDIRDGSAEGGRWVVRPEVPAAIPSAVLAFDAAFGPLKLREVRGTTVSTNQRALSLNRRFGFRELRVEKNAQVIGGQPIDLVHVVLPAGDWPGVRERLAPMAQLAEPQVREWERANPQGAQVKI